MTRYLALSFFLAAALVLPTSGQEPNDKVLDIQSSGGSLHVGPDADAKKIGVPLYPGARARSGDDHNDQANLSLFTESFGMKLLVAGYESNDAPAKVIDFYRDKLRKYGKVLECHSDKHGGNVEMKDNGEKDSSQKKELKCEQDSGPVTELKVGTEDNQHVVAVEPNDSGSGTKFTLVYVHSRGKKADI
jgi:hypothetical protein